MKNNKYFLLLFLFVGLLASCGGKKQSSESLSETTTAEIPEFNADSALSHVVSQCNFGPRLVGSEAHGQCGEYIVGKFRQYGFDVTRQMADFTFYDGTRQKGYNIIAQSNPKAESRILIAAHWDSRPWADNDPNPAYHKNPILGANDGASGVAIMLEVARLLQSQKPEIGIDFVCFDAEDAGTPQWAEKDEDASDTWCLGSQYWAAHPHATGFRFGLLLDMVGGQGAHFYREGYSMQYASSVVAQFWAAAKQAGYGTFFKEEGGGYITDDHLPVNRIARIPMADIIPYYPTAETGFGPTWHTMADTPENIDRNTLKAVGQSLLQLIYSLEK